MRQKLLFNNGWEFVKQSIGSDMQDLLQKKEQWQKIDIPHDWMIYDTDYFEESCEGWYRKRFDLSSVLLPEQLQEQTKARYLLRFEGVYMDSTVWVNGIMAGEWKYGYSTFEFDITDALKPGLNEIMVRAVLQLPNSRWYSGAGIYRNVWLKVVPEQHFASDGIYISTEKNQQEWTVKIHSEIICNGRTDTSNKDNICSIRHSILDSEGKTIASTPSCSNDQMITITDPRVWSVTEPNLYQLRSELIIDGKTVDEERNLFGFRTIRFDTEEGFFLNDRHIKLHGVCQHHDMGALGSAVNKTALKRQFTILKEMGVNAIRTSHNMPAVELLELADEMGILIIDEAFDMWERPKTRFDYARFFPEWAERDVASWIRRDRNHPSIIMWSIGNEIYDTHAGERGQAVTEMLMEMVHRHDPNWNAYVTIGSNYMPWENAQKCADIVKLAGYNYAEKYYASHHEKHKDWMIYGSETGSVVQSRGIYHFPLSEEILSDDDEQCSSLGNSTTSWGARSIEQCIADDRNAGFSAGMFIWSGFDYIGEPTPYHTKNSYFGQIDTAGFKKDAFYIYQAEWTDYKVSPMVHLFPYWDFSEGQQIDVCVCSNAPEVELFFNGCSQGKFQIDHVNGSNLVGRWQLPYQKGELLAVAYDENGAVLAKDLQKSFSDAEAIRLVPNKTQLTADGRDLIFVEISMEDKDGNPVHNANNRVNVNVTGAGRLVGLDNGDSTDYDSYKGTSRRLFGGKLLAVIAAKTTPGNFRMEVTSVGLLPVSLSLTAKEGIVPEGITALEENHMSPSSAEIPVRKLEIISSQGTSLNSELREADLEVKLCPANATYSDVTWRVAAASGADTNIAVIEANGKHARIKALGDGTFYVRASVKNGGEKTDLISLLDFRVNGIGTAYFDPYEFVSGSLYTRSIGETTSGNERGVATARDGETIVVFEHLNFGDFGSDTITIPIFELGGAPTPIEIWEGVPGEDGSELLAAVVYHKRPIWNTYQEETYRLNKRLTGITSISFLLKSKVHIKGFSFTKLLKAYEQLPAYLYSSLYGDTYRVGKDSIEGIGNNVTLTFDQMDFPMGIHKLVICGRSSIDNTIQVRFNGTGGQSSQLVEFLHSDEYTEREFELENVTGLQTVEFLFLPGCNFDFKWFRFMK